MARRRVKGQIDQQLLLLGDRPQPRRHRLPRLDDQGRSAGRRRIPLRPRTGIAGQRADPLAGRERDRDDAHRRDDDRPEPRGAATRSPATCRQQLPGTFRLRANADYFSSVVDAAAYQQDVMRATNRSRRFGTNVTGTLGPLPDQRDGRPQRLLLLPRSRSRPTAAMPRINVSRPRTADRRSAGLLRREQRVRRLLCAARRRTTSRRRIRG